MIRWSPMLSLRELERQFGAWIFGNDAAELTALIEPDGWPVEDRLAIYRNNVFASLTKALAASFPVVARLVGEGFFAYAAHEFLISRPPVGACLARYGAAFPDFLAGFPPCHALAYLADVARFEWLMVQAAQASEASPLSPSQLAGIAEADTPRLVLGLDPAISYLRSPHPIDRIWAANRSREEPEADIDLAAGGVLLEVRRGGEDVVYRALDAASFAFRTAIAAGAPLESAVAAALAAEPGFDLAAALRALFEEGAVVSITLAEREET